MAGTQKGRCRYAEANYSIDRYEGSKSKAEE